MLGSGRVATDVVVVSDGPIPVQAAYAVQIVHVTSAFAELGLRTRLIGPWRRGDALGDAWPELVQPYGPSARFPFRRVPFLEVRGRLRGSFALAAALAARLASPRLVFTRNPRVGRVAATLGMDVAVELHGPPNSRSQAEALRWLGRSPRCRGVVCISERLRQLVAEPHGLDERRLVVEHDGVDLGRFSTPCEPAEARARLGVDTGGRAVVLHSGSLYQGRGGERLVELADRLPGAELWFVGGRPDDVRRVSDLARARGVADRCRFFGHRPLSELPDFYRAADVLVMTYTSDARTVDGKTRSIEWASPMKAFEYMAAGRPIVSGTFAGLAEVLVDGRNASLVPPDDFDALGTAVAALLAEPERGRALAARAAEDVAFHAWPARARRLAARLGLA